MKGSALTVNDYRKQLFETISSSNYSIEVNVDRSVIENCFDHESSINALRYTPTIEKEIESDKQLQIEAIKEILEFNLPLLEKEVIKRIYFEDMKQEGIAKLYGVSQEMVSYYKARAEKRIEYFMKTKNIGIQHMEEDLREIVTQKQLEALIMYYRIHNQNIIAHKCNVTQSAISTRIKLGMRQLRSAAKTRPELIKYCEIFRFLTIYNSLQGYQNKTNKSQIILEIVNRKKGGVK